MRAAQVAVVVDIQELQNHDDERGGDQHGIEQGKVAAAREQPGCQAIGQDG